MKIEKINFSVIECENLSKIVVFFSVIALLLIIGSGGAYALKNPAAVYCEQMGYEYIIVSTEIGEKGVCKLPGDRLVNAWWFLRGEVGAEHSYCKKQGYEIKTVTDIEKCSYIFSSKCALCVLPDGTEIEVAKLMKLNFNESECGDGTCGMPENFKTCPGDCPSGEIDEYCDGISDGKCDPDCEYSNRTDPDCALEETGRENLTRDEKEETGTGLDMNLVIIVLGAIILILIIIIFMRRK